MKRSDFSDNRINRLFVITCHQSLERIRQQVAIIIVVFRIAEAITIVVKSRILGAVECNVLSAVVEDDRAFRIEPLVDPGYFAEVEAQLGDCSVLGWQAGDFYVQTSYLYMFEAHVGRFIGNGLIPRRLRRDCVDECVYSQKSQG